MEESIKENGKMASNTVKANFTILKQKLGKKEFGAMDAECNGIIHHLHKLMI